ncbi:hypothetical protein C6P61_13840 [Malikia spinosa]|uniref:Uncharacterized protein n=2 Tax=Malikia spinosa TaxID=86180 RepID=A0A2S9KBS3_9BURK|nr:hypothetical protein C6P61_13840 [Malikia spinosa]
MQHGQYARANLDKAVAEKLPIFGFEAEPNKAALERGERSVKHFYLDRTHQLQGRIGLSLYELEKKLHIEDAFRKRGIADEEDPNLPASLFELVGTTIEPPAAGDYQIEDAREEHEVDLPLEGNQSADVYARKALPILVAHVLQQQDGVMAPITYRRLAELLGRRNRHGDPWARGLGFVLGRVTELIDGVRSRLTEPPPFLTSIVVLSSGPNVGLPDKGVSGVWPGYETMSREEKRAKLAAEFQRILAYRSRWNEVLRLAGLPVIEPPVGSNGIPVPGGWGGGESEAHLALKLYVRDHPELVGARADWDAWVEYALRSADELEVMFLSDRVWIGVEVKSRTSDRNLADYERGIYQVVKYRSILEAQALVDFPDAQPEIRVVLLLERELPAVYRALAAHLRVTVIDGIVPTNAQIECDA